MKPPISTFSSVRTRSRVEMLRSFGAAVGAGVVPGEGVGVGVAVVTVVRRHAVVCQIDPELRVTDDRVAENGVSVGAICHRFKDRDTASYVEGNEVRAAGGPADRVIGRVLDLNSIGHVAEIF